jgi:hypothetical protein
VLDRAVAYASRLAAGPGATKTAVERFLAGDPVRF